MGTQKPRSIEKVVKSLKSKIPKAGKGLFAVKDLKKGDIICYYSGKLIDSTDCKYHDPTYIVEFELGKGYKLIGDYLDKDPGLFANSVHPDYELPMQNARFVTKEKKITSANRGRFPIKAIRDISASEEIIVNYGVNYWVTLEKWKKEGNAKKTEATSAREQRALRRVARFDQR